MKSVFEVGPHRDIDRRQGGDLPEVPVLPETLLCLELCRYEQFVHLNELADLILSDLGATIQVMRSANTECSFVDGLPHRIEDCIAALGVSGCLDAISGHRPISRRELQLVRRVWDHAKAIAQGCRRIAEEYRREIRPSNAYLVGLLHELDSLPILLGWESKRRISCNSKPAGVRLAKVWSLPGCVLEYFMELSDPRSTTQWTELLEQAHAMQNIRSSQRPRRDQTTPRALESVGLQSVAL